VRLARVKKNLRSAKKGVEGVTEVITREESVSGESGAIATSSVSASDVENAVERQKRWLRRMSTGGSGRSGETTPSETSKSEEQPVKRRKGVEEVKMREDTVFGGFPRSRLYSAKDWWHNMVSLPNSAILSDISGPVMSIASWATLISLVHRSLLKKNPIWASMMCLSGTPFSMTRIGITPCFSY